MTVYYSSSNPADFGNRPSKSRDIRITGRHYQDLLKQLDKIADARLYEVRGYIYTKGRKL